jgi:hypothetical protein
MKHLFRALLLIVGLAGLAPATWAAITPDQVATRIRARMMNAWPCSNLHVTVTPYAHRTNVTAGAYQQIKVSADAIVIDHVRMTNVLMCANDPVVDLAKLTQQNKFVLLRRSGNTIRGCISEYDLNKALTRKKNTIENLHAKIGQGCIIFTGRYKFGLSAGLMLQGRLEVPDGYRINFVPTKASVGGIPLPAAPLRTVLGKMNPLLDLQKVMMSPKLSRLVVGSGVVQLIG